MRAENPFQCPNCFGRIYGYDELVWDEFGEVFGCINCVECTHKYIDGMHKGGKITNLTGPDSDGDMDRSSLAEFIPKWI